MGIVRNVYTCPDCGSTDIERYASATWSYERQEWVLAGLVDSFACRACGQGFDVPERHARGEADATGGILHG